MKAVKMIKNLVLGKRNNQNYFWELRQKALNKKNFFRYFYSYKYIKLVEKYNSFIPLSTQIDGIPCFPHGPCGVFISGKAKIGKNCVIFHQCTIGSNTILDSKGQGAPTIGDNVYIGAGAKIIGNVIVGNNVRIGANCVVTKDVPDNTTVVCATERRIIKAEPMDNHFVDISSWDRRQNRTN